MDADCVHFFVLEQTMKQKVRFLAHGALIAALYAVVTHMQNLIPGGNTWGPIQFRISEVLCVLAFFTPAAIPGLTIGCLLFNITSDNPLPIDFLVGSLASALAAGSMWLTRSTTVKGYPLLGLLMPAIFNGLLVGWELTVYLDVPLSFWLNAGYVALGETVVLLIPGSILYLNIKTRRLDKRLFD
jgi:uncharacterized membrane protein